jgi:hypothetical protein
VVLNMTACGEGGVLLRSMGLTGLGCGEILGGWRDFSRFIRFRVGNGSKIRF